MAIKIDSNVTGLRYCEESSLGVLPGSPVWYPLEPNSYKDFGGQLNTVARKPIDPTRQMKKGSVVGLDASGGFNQDLTQDNLTRLLQGIMFADIREKPSTTQPLNSTAVVITAVAAAGQTFAAASGLGSFLVNSLVISRGFSNAANNGLRKATTVAATLLTCAASGLVDEASPPAGARVDTCGYEFASATLDVVMSGGLPRLNRASGAFDFTTLGLVPGEWIYIGSDDAASTRFANNTGWGRVSAVAAGYIELDKTSFAPQAETGTGKTIRIFFGNVIKNESAVASIKRRTYQVERQLGADANGTMSEYLIGAVPNEFTLDIKQADKVLTDVDFIAIDNEQRTGLVGLKSGTRPSLATWADTSPFNTSSDVQRTVMAVVSTNDPDPTPLFAYITDLKLTVKNNVSPVKAVAALAAIEASAGILEVSGTVEAYFADIAAVQSVRNNADVTIDCILAKNNAGIAFDLPLLSLGDGRLKVEADKPITLPLSMNAAASPKFNHTILFNVFPYLPSAAC